MFLYTISYYEVKITIINIIDLIVSLLLQMCLNSAKRDKCQLRITTLYISWIIASSKTAWYRPKKILQLIGITAWLISDL